MPAVAGAGRAVLVALLLTGCATASGPSQASSGATPTASPSSIVRTTRSPSASPTQASAVIARAREALAALKARNGAAFAALVDPIKGVRFTPYPYLRTDRDVVLSAAEAGRGFTDPQLRLWGLTDGKGDPIRLAFADYVGRYVYDRDWLVRAEVSVDRTQENGNTIDNARTVYPAATLVEFYQPSSPNTLDWRAVRLLFEQRDGTWYLVAIVHAEWTI